jgi:hypothetical protein
MYVLTYFWNLAVLASHGLNTFTGGHPRDSLSARCGRQADCKLCAWLCRMLDKIDPNHCADEAAGK